jgi:hypothetical protein
MYFNKQYIKLLLSIYWSMIRDKFKKIMRCIMRHFIFIILIFLFIACSDCTEKPFVCIEGDAYYMLPEHNVIGFKLDVNGDKIKCKVEYGI